MVVETNEFSISNPIFDLIQSREITADRMRPAAVKGGLNSAEVTCKKCQHSWTARQFGEGSFTPALGAVLFECPSCKNQGNVPASRLA